MVVTATTVVLVGCGLVVVTWKVPKFFPSGSSFHARWRGVETSGTRWNSRSISAAMPNLARASPSWHPSGMGAVGCLGSPLDSSLSSVSLSVWPEYCSVVLESATN